MQVLVVSFLAGSGGVLQVGQDLGPGPRPRAPGHHPAASSPGRSASPWRSIAGWVLAERAMRPIRRAFDRQRAFAADASHELRTPLAVVDAGLQMLARHPDEATARHAETLDAMRAETGRMNRLVGGLLTLARADSGAAAIAPVETDLDALVRAPLPAIGRWPPRRARASSSSRRRRASARVDPDRIAELLGILVDNALRHGGPGVQRPPGARAGRRGVELIVSDDGIGIPEAERAVVMERFVRGDLARSGEGIRAGALDRPLDRRRPRRTPAARGQPSRAARPGHPPA